MLRAVRLLNAIETGNTNGPCLDTLLCADAGRCSDFSTLMTLPGQTYVIASSPTAMCNIFNSNAATCVVLSYPIMCSRFTCNPSSSSLSANSGVTQAIGSYVNSSCAMTKLANLATNFSALTTGNNTCFVNCFFSSSTAVCIFSTTSCSLNYSCGYGHTTMNSFLASAYGSCWFPYMSFQNNPCTYSNLAGPYISTCTFSCTANCNYCINNMCWNPRTVSSIFCNGTMWWVMQGCTCNANCCMGICAPNPASVSVTTPSAVVSPNCGLNWYPIFASACAYNITNQQNTLYSYFNNKNAGFLLGYPGQQFITSAVACVGTTGSCFCLSCVVLGTNAGANWNCAPCGYISQPILSLTSNCYCCFTSFSFGPGICTVGYSGCCYAYYCMSGCGSCAFNVGGGFTNITIANVCCSQTAIWVITNGCTGCYAYVNQNSINTGNANCCTCYQCSTQCCCLCNMCFCALAAICYTMILIPTNTACKVVLTCDAQTFTCGTNNPCSFVGGGNIQQFFCVCNYIWAWPVTGQTATYSTNCGATWTCYCLPYNASSWNPVVVNGGWVAVTPCESNNKVFYSPNCGITWYTANLNSNACWAVVCNSGSNNCWFSAVNCSGCVQHIY